MSIAGLSPAFDPGTVWLVGAGPGDPGLLTVHALNALQQADVVVHDALVDRRILELARVDAALEYAGKRGGKPSVLQRDISDRLTALAMEGKRVLRLKGGDPFIFGRGCEEALALAAAGIRFRIVPGVSSGLASLAVHGVPATMRATNHAVILATGHRAGEESVDWAALGRADVPIVLYMAVANLGSIVPALIRGGLDPKTPALAVHAATTADEDVVEGSLEDLPRLAAAGTIRAPAVIAIGAIAALRSEISGHLQRARPEAAE